MEIEEADQDYHSHDSISLNHEGQIQVTKVPVVQELARRGLSSNHVPQRFKRKNDQKVLASHEAFIPCISLAKLRDDQKLSQDARDDDELANLRRGAEEWGMFLITDHGMESGMMGKVKEVVNDFFDLPFEVKKASVGTRNNIDNMGYGRNFVKWDKPVDWIDRLTMKAAPAEAVDVSVWPITPPDFREVMGMYVDEARKVLNELLNYLAQAFGLHKEEFTRHFDPVKTEINVRVNYYPPCPFPESVMGLTPHTDASCLTLLMESKGSGALQVMNNKSKKWFTVPWLKDTLLVSAGDLLEIMSNGRVVSPWHRVVAQQNVERFSVVLFYNPPGQTEIEPVTECEEGTANYRRIVVNEYLQHFYDISPTEDKQAIMYAKLD